MTPERVLITGGNGNLGRLVAERFETLGAEVASFDLPGTEGPHCAARAEVVLGDIRDTAEVEALIERFAPQAVIHLASLLSGSSEADPARAWEVNASASFRLMEVAARKAEGPFVFASTIATYGPGLPADLPEDAPQWPANVYGATKVAVERAGYWAKAARGLDFRCLRFPMVLSPFAPPGAVTAYPSHAFWAAAKGEPFEFPVAEDTGMSTLFLEDVTRSLVDVTLAERAQIRRPAYNLHGFHFTAGQLAEAIRAAFPDARLGFSPDAKVDAMIRAWPDRLQSSAGEDWGWQPAWDFERTVAEMVRLVGGGEGAP